MNCFRVCLLDGWYQPLNNAKCLRTPQFQLYNMFVLERFVFYLLRIFEPYNFNLIRCLQVNADGNCQKQRAESSMLDFNLDVSQIKIIFSCSDEIIRLTFRTHRSKSNGEKRAKGLYCENQQLLVITN